MCGSPLLHRYWIRVWHLNCNWSNFLTSLSSGSLESSWGSRLIQKDLSSNLCHLLLARWLWASPFTSLGLVFTSSVKWAQYCLLCLPHRVAMRSHKEDNFCGNASWIVKFCRNVRGWGGILFDGSKHFNSYSVPGVILTTFCVCMHLLFPVTTWDGKLRHTEVKNLPS